MVPATFGAARALHARESGLPPRTQVAAAVRRAEPTDSCRTNYGRAIPHQVPGIRRLQTDPRGRTNPICRTAWAGVDGSTHARVHGEALASGTPACSEC